MQWHRLKTHPDAFDAILRGDKTFEYCRNDRDFNEGDKVILERFDPAVEKVSPGFPVIVADIGFVLRAQFFGVPDGFCVFSLLYPCTPDGLIQRKTRA